MDEHTTARVVTVTGGSGLIGRRLLPLLEQHFAEVRVLTRDGRVASTAATPVRGDLLDAAALRELVRGADAVVHLAGMAHTTLRTQAEVEEAFATNVGGTRALLQAALAAGTSRFVLISSAHVYAGRCGMGLREDAETGAASPYAAMKLEGEQAAKEAAAQGLSMAVLRPCLTYGPGVRHNLEALLRALRGGYYVQVRGAQTVRSMASVDTVAAAILHLLRHREHTGAFNVADREPVVLEAWVDHLASLMGARRPARLPLALLRTLATAGTLAGRVGLPSPLTQASLAKLTAPFSLDVGKLASTGFAWPATGDDVLRQMIAAAAPR